MNIVLVLYPEPFNCYEKLERKVARIVSGMAEYSIVTQSDPKGLLARFAASAENIVELVRNPSWTVTEVTHAILFDDGSYFSDEYALLSSSEVPIRLVDVRLTRVVNVKNHARFSGIKSSREYEYIGRGSYWGNPYSMYEDGDERDEVIRKYKYDFDFDKFPNKNKSEVHLLQGKILGCHCKPAACHGDILADYLNRMDDGI